MFRKKVVLFKNSSKLSSRNTHVPSVHGADDDCPSEGPDRPIPASRQVDPALHHLAQQHPPQQLRVAPQTVKAGLADGREGGVGGHQHRVTC